MSANDALNQLYNQQTDRRVAARQYTDSRDIAASEGVRNLAYNVATQPLDMQANLFSSSTFTPWNTRNVDSLFPDASPSAAFGTNFGQTLAGFGGTLLGNYLGGSGGSGDSVHESLMAVSRGDAPGVLGREAAGTGHRRRLYRSWTPDDNREEFW